MTPRAWLLCVAALVLLSIPYLPALLPASGDPVLLGEAHPDPLVRDDSDAYEGCWHFWWTSRALSGGLDPRHCGIVDPPEGVSLAYQHIGWVDTFLWFLSGIPESDPVLAYNANLLAGTLLTALFAWLLARAWGLGPFESLVAALMIAWLPARTARVIQHYQLADCWTLTASLWLCRSWMRSPSTRKYAGYTVATAAASLQSPFFGLFSLVALPLTAWIARCPWRRAARLSAGALAGAAAGLLAVATAPGGAGSPAMDPGEAVYWAAEPEAFLLPSPFGIPAAIAGMPRRLPWMPNASEGVAGTGIVVLLLLIPWKRRPGAWRFAVAASALFLLGLGPELKLLGVPRGLPLPFALIRGLPVIEGIRAPSRFALLGGMFAALGAARALQSMGRGKKAAVAGMVVLELFVPSLPTVPADVPPEVMTIGSEETVLEIPVMPNVRRYSLYQARGGYARRYAFLARPPAGTDPEPPGAADGSVADVVVYHRGIMPPGALAAADSVAALVFGVGDLSARDVWLIRPGEAGP